METVNENDSLSKSIDELFRGVDEWIANSEVKLFAERNQEVSAQSELTSSRLKEHERLTTSFTYQPCKLMGICIVLLKIRIVKQKCLQVGLQCELYSP